MRCVLRQCFDYVTVSVDSYSPLLLLDEETVIFPTPHFILRFTETTFNIYLSKVECVQVKFYIAFPLLNGLQVKYNIAFVLYLMATSAI